MKNQTRNIKKMEIETLKIEDKNGLVWEVFFHELTWGNTIPERNLILEALRKELVGLYSARKDQPHNSTGQYHLHVFWKNKELWAINMDGTAHDRSHDKIIPRVVFDAIGTKFPDFNLPVDRIIECLMPQSNADEIILENTIDNIYERYRFYKNFNYPNN